MSPLSSFSILFLSCFLSLFPFLSSPFLSNYFPSSHSSPYFFSSPLIFYSLLSLFPLLSFLLLSCPYFLHSFLSTPCLVSWFSLLLLSLLSLFCLLSSPLLFFFYSSLPILSPFVSLSSLLSFRPRFLSSLQFVPFRDYIDRRGNHILSMARLAKEVLAEIPDQFLSYMRTRGIKPGPLPPPYTPCPPPAIHPLLTRRVSRI